MAEKNYADGLFVKEFESRYGLMLSIGVKKEQFQTWLDEQEENENGFVNLFAGPAKDAPHWSIWLAEQQQNSSRSSRSSRGSSRQQSNTQRGSRGTSTQQRRAASKPQTRRAPEPEYEGDQPTDDLPF